MWAPTCRLMTTPDVLVSLSLSQVGGESAAGHVFLLRSHLPAKMRPTPGSPRPVLPAVLALTLAAFLPQLSSGATPFPQDLEPISIVGRECKLRKKKKNLLCCHGDPCCSGVHVKVKPRHYISTPGERGLERWMCLRACSQRADLQTFIQLLAFLTHLVLFCCLRVGGKKGHFNSGLNIRNTHEKTFRDGSWGAVCKEWGSAPGNKPYLQVFFMVIEGGLWHETASCKLLQHLNHFTVNLFTLVCARAMWMEPIQSTSDVFAWLGWFVKPGVKTVN